MKIFDVSTIIKKRFFNIAFHFFDSRYMIVFTVMKTKENQGK